MFTATAAPNKSDSFSICPESLKRATVKKHQTCQSVAGAGLTDLTGICDGHCHLQTDIHFLFSPLPLSRETIPQISFLQTIYCDGQHIETVQQFLLLSRITTDSPSHKPNSYSEAFSLQSSADSSNTNSDFWNFVILVTT